MSHFMEIHLLFIFLVNISIKWICTFPLTDLIRMKHFFSCQDGITKGSKICDCSSGYYLQSGASGIQNICQCFHSGKIHN